MSVIEEKKALRTFIRKKERTLDPVYKAESSEAICRHLLALDEYKSAKVVFAFAGTEKEIDTSLFMNETIAAGKTLILPRCAAEHAIDLCVVVIGRSLVIGKPVSLLLLAEHATVTICHSRSENLPEICREADILVVAAGKAGMVGAESVRAGQVVLDVGIHVGADGNLCGDTRFAEVEPVVEAITPVPGGVGTVTSTILASHVVEAAERAANQ